MLSSSTRFKYEAPTYRASIGGKQSLRRMAVTTPSKEVIMPNIPPTDFDDQKITRFNVKKSSDARHTRFDAANVSNGLFKAKSDNIYQGFKESTTYNRLPLQWDPVGEATIRPEVAGSAYNNGDGYVQYDENLDKKEPKLGQQWRRGKGKFLSPDDPNPFPIRNNPKMVLK